MNTLKCPNVHVIACDLDDSLVATRGNPEQLRHASDKALRQLGGLITDLRTQSSQSVYFGSSTGRSLESIQELAAERPAFRNILKMMDFHIASVGTAIYEGAASNFRRVPGWPNVASWNREALVYQLSTEPDLTLQGPNGQAEHKISYTTTSILDNQTHSARLSSSLNMAGLQANVVVSGGGSWRFVDVLPIGVDKGSASLQIPRLLHTPSPDTANMPKICRVAAGDSLNDKTILATADVSIIPLNGQPDLLEWTADQTFSSLYIADESFAAGVLQGLQRHLYGIN